MLLVKPELLAAGSQSLFISMVSTITTVRTSIDDQMVSLANSCANLIFQTTIKRFIKSSKILSPKMVMLPSPPTDVDSQNT